MARKTSRDPKYWEKKNGYFVTINGQRIRLADGPDCPEQKKKAEQKLFELLSRQDSIKAGDNQACYGILEEYCQYIRGKFKPNTVEAKVYYIQLFTDDCGRIPCAKLTPQHLERLIQKMEQPRQIMQGKSHKQSRTYQWGHASRQACITHLYAAFSWAVKRRLLTENPLRGIEMTQSRSRGREALISENDHQKLVAVARPGMRDLLTALNDTGARPGAIYRVEAADLHDLGNGVMAWLGTEQKRQRFGFPGVVYLTPAVVEIHKRLAAQYPEGPLFRNRLGVQWEDSAVERWFERKREELGLNPKICPYSYRHKFATEWLLAGKPIAYLAELQNTSIRMISKHYGHLREHGSMLHSSLLDFRGRPQDGGPTQVELRPGRDDTNGGVGDT